MIVSARMAARTRGPEPASDFGARQKRWVGDGDLSWLVGLAALAFFATAACLFFYPISRKINKDISDELAGRREGFAGKAGA